MTAPVRGSDFSHAMRLCAPTSDPIETALPVAEIADVAPRDDDGSVSDE